jgi:glycerol kinase
VSDGAPHTGAPYIGAIDQGTTSTRFIIFDREARVVALDQREHRQITPAPGLVEHDAEEILANTRACIAAALAKAGLGAADLAAIGITNQRETTLIWDRASGRPLGPALVWQDTRVAPMVARLAEEGGASAGGVDRFRAKTGLPLASYFSALKLRWLLDHIPGARARAEAGEVLFGTIDSWLAWNLTGGPAGGLHITDVTNASRTQLMALASCAWDDELLAAFAIPRACLPRIVASSAPLGEITDPVLRGVPLAALLGDQQAALVGQACFAPGEAKNTYGTGSFLLMNTGETPILSRAGLITTVAYRFGDAAPCYALEGSIAVTGALVQWLRDNLGLIASAPEIEALAASVPDNGGVYIVPAFSGLYAPYWNEAARGLIIGLTRFAGRAHLARAALEAAAYQIRDVALAMARDSGIALTGLKCDGGMAANDLLLQFQADILAAPVLRPSFTETTALGAAYAAGLAVGIWRDPAEIASHWRLGRGFAPAMASRRRDTLCHDWARAVARARDWVEPEAGADR